MSESEFIIVSIFNLRSLFSHVSIKLRLNSRIMGNFVLKINLRDYNYWRLTAWSVPYHLIKSSANCMLLLHAVYAKLKKIISLNNLVLILKLILALTVWHCRKLSSACRGLFKLEVECETGLICFEQVSDSYLFY